MVKLVLYSLDLSPPCRAVLLVADMIGVPLEVREISLKNNDHLKPEFLKINPQHTIPTLDDNGFILTDSHAILTYLVEKYGKDDSLYPKDPQKRALIHQFLHTDSSILFSLAKSIIKPIIRDETKTVTERQLEQINECYDMLNKFLEDKQWLVGDSYTIADISCIITVLALSVLRPIEGHPNLEAWVKRCAEEMPGYQRIILPGHEMLKQLCQSKLE